MKFEEKLTAIMDLGVKRQCSRLPYNGLNYILFSPHKAKTQQKHHSTGFYVDQTPPLSNLFVDDFLKIVEFIDSSKALFSEIIDKTGEIVITTTQ